MESLLLATFCIIAESYIAIMIIQILPLILLLFYTFWLGEAFASGLPCLQKKIDKLQCKDGFAQYIWYENRKLL